MPMNTTLVTAADASAARNATASVSPFPFAAANLRACASCSRISPEVRFPSSPSVPVAQNVHPILHPTCEETHSVFRPPSCRMSTDSTRWPSCSFTTNFAVVPSPEVATESTEEVRSANASGRRSRANAGRFGTAATERSKVPEPRSAAATAASWMVRRCRSAVSRFPGPRPSSRNASNAGASKKL